MKNGKPKTYPIPQYKGEPGKIPCPHCNRPLADEKQLESHIKRFIVNIILFSSLSTMSNMDRQLLETDSQNLRIGKISK
jgi:hypothetical protein